MDLEPLVATDPDQPPEAVQAVALLELQPSVELLPFATLVGLAMRATVGAAALTVTSADWEAEPPGPVQVSV